MANYTIQDSATGKNITFQWSGENPPTQEDMAHIIETAGQQEPAKPDNGRVDGVPKWGRDNPNLYAGVETALDLAPAIASFAKSSGIGIPIAGAVNAGAKAIQRGIAGEDQSFGATLGDFAKGATVEGVGRGIGKGIQAVTNIPAVRAGLDKVSKKLYQSAMKFSTSPTVLPAADRAAITETGLRHNFMPTDEDYLRLKDMVGANTNKVNSIIDAGTAKGDTIPAKKIIDLADFQKLYGRGESVRGVTPGYSGAVGRVEDTLMRGESPVGAFGPDIPRPYTPTDINVSKRQLYKELEDAYAKNTLSKPSVQAKKQLARGLKEALEAQYPEIKNINASSKELLDLSDHLARSIGRVQNRDIIGLGDKVVMDMVGSIPKESLTGKSTVGFIASILDRPMAKAKLARILYKANTGRDLPLSQWQKGVKYIGEKLNSAPVRGAFDAAVLGATSDPLGLR